MAAELANERHRLAALHLTEDLSVRAVFDVSYHALPDDAARVYRQLALVPGPDFGLELAAVATAADQADRLVGTLVDANLLEESPGERYRFHDLVHVHARDQAEAEETDAERDAVVARSVEWYVRGAVAADLVVTAARWHLNPMYEQLRAESPAFSGPAEALEWLETSLPGLLAAVRAARDQGLHERAWQLCEALWGLFWYRKQLRPWIDTHIVGLASAHACGDRKAEARMRVQLGYAYFSSKKYPEAVEQFTEALALSRRDGHSLGEGTALEQLALVDLRQGRHDEAIRAFTEARVIFGRIGVARGVALMTRHIGEAHLAAGRYSQAMDDLGQARSMFVDLSDAYMQARTMTSLAQVHVRAGQPSEAAELLNEALALVTDLGAHHEEARIRVALAEVAEQIGDIVQARDHLCVALAIYSRINAPEADEIRLRLDSHDSDAAGP
jgi:tetratricopeptide (TPR) repeat protein